MNFGAFHKPILTVFSGCNGFLCLQEKKRPPNAKNIFDVQKISEDIFHSCLSTHPPPQKKIMNKDKFSKISAKLIQIHDFLVSKQVEKHLN